MSETKPYLERDRIVRLFERVVVVQPYIKEAKVFDFGTGMN
jgi:hypothetical protein